MTFERQTDTAARLIAKNGGPCTVVITHNVDAPGGNPWDTTPDQTEERTDGAGVFLRFKTGQYGQTFPNGDVIHSDDRKVLIAAKGLNFTPNLKGYLIRHLPNGDENWAIEGIDPLDPNGEQIMFTMQVRR